MSLKDKLVSFHSTRTSTMVSCIFKPALCGVMATVLHGALAVSGPYEQCRGIGFSGDVDCTTGYACVAQNDCEPTGVF
ncbi:hypothetical protein K504DRAFT_274778 [Pleomassaria siparia CBS 279.74]|uniref:CBM1 domain-containing protein n=1 Tax=Pleomassaria siparia CBS 279.74 TaxID=1314801 RepID=A0A6G1KAR9_9PLEO|nr:hypothetical protein K504DRAFT_274778 [Pleomassaria siparia CBS 279.74]